jgi:hypothetical protein
MRPESFRAFLVIMTVLAVLWTGLTYLIYLAFRELYRVPAGGWESLSARFQTLREPLGPLVRQQTVRAGQVTHSRCVDIGLFDNGLYLRLNSTPARTVLIPWGEFRDCNPDRLDRRQALRFTIGDPPIASLTLNNELARSFADHLTDLPRLTPNT